MWQVGLNARGVALGLVCLACVFITLWVAIGAALHNNYETPTPVHNSHLFIFSSLLTPLVSIGAGSVLSSRKNALVANTSGCGMHYLLRRYCTFRCISGRRVSGRSTKRTSFIGGALIRGLDTHRDGQRWECFCKPSHLLSSREFCSQTSIIKLPLGILRRRPSSLHSTVVTVRSPPCIVGGHVFHRLIVLPLWCHQRPPVPDHQTGTPPFPPSRGTSRAARARH